LGGKGIKEPKNYNREKKNWEISKNWRKNRDGRIEGPGEKDGYIKRGGGIGKGANHGLLKVKNMGGRVKMKTTKERF